MTVPTESSPSAPGAQSGMRLHAIGVGAIALAMAIMAFISWQKWGDILTDLGHQLYVPWVLSEGGLLYRDVSYLYGPLSSYLHALVFWIFGPGALYLALFNLLLAAITAVTLYVLFLRLFNPVTATLAGVAFGTVFVFGHPTHEGNFNFIWPYVYDLTHGVFLAIAALYQFERFLHDARVHRIGIIGFLLGCIYLTKSEVFLAAAGSILPGMVWCLHRASTTHRLSIMKTLFMLLCMLAPSFLFFIYFSLHTSIGEALTWLIQPWVHVFNADVRTLRYYQYILGSSDLSANLLRICLYTLALGACLGTLFGINQVLTRKGWNTASTSVFVALGVVGFFVLFFYQIPWLNLLPPLPLLVLLFIGYQSKQLWDRRQTADTDVQKRDLALLTFALFALLLMLKILFRVRVYHYGFALAMPGTVLLIGILTHTLPEKLKTHWGSMKTFRAGVIASVLVFVLMMNYSSGLNYARKQFPIGQGVDRIIDFAPQMLIVAGRPRVEGMMTEYAVEYIEKNMSASAQFVAFPEFDILNYLTRRKSPVPDTKFNPGVGAVLGEASVLSRLQANPPQHLVLVGKEFHEFGTPFFGADFGQDIYQWIRQHYQIVKQIGPPPFEGKGFGIQFLKLRSEPRHDRITQP